MSDYHITHITSFKSSELNSRDSRTGRQPHGCIIGAHNDSGLALRSHGLLLVFITLFFWNMLTFLFDAGDRTKQWHSPLTTDVLMSSNVNHLTDIIFKSCLLISYSATAGFTRRCKWKLTLSFCGWLWRRGLPSPLDRGSQSLVLQTLPLLPWACGEPPQPPYGTDWPPGWWRWSVGSGGGPWRAVVNDHGHWCSQ